VEVDIMRQIPKPSLTVPETRRLFDHSTSSTKRLGTVKDDVSEIRGRCPRVWWMRENLYTQRYRRRLMGPILSPAGWITTEGKANVHWLGGVMRRSDSPSICARSCGGNIADRVYCGVFLFLKATLPDIPAPGVVSAQPDQHS
jgi:hypothetical protein